VPGPQYPLGNPQEASLKDEGFHQALDMPDRKPRNASETLIGNPGVLAKEIRFGENGVENDAF
jgi:hypothetical protein